MDFAQVKHLVDGIDEKAIQSIRAGDYEALFWLLHERQRLIDAIQPEAVNGSTDQIDDLFEKTKQLHARIELEFTDIQTRRAMTIESAVAMRSYAKTSLLSRGSI